MKIKEFVFKYFYKYKELITYIFFGGLTTLINIIAYYILGIILNLPTVFSVVAAWIIAVFFAYFTNKIYVFNSRSFKLNVLVKEMSSFLFFRLASLGVDVLIMIIFVDYLNCDKLITKIAANVVVVIMNYLASKLFIFKKK